MSPRLKPAPELPEGESPDVRIASIKIEALDVQRIRCIIVLSQGNVRPDLIIVLSDEDGQPLASITVLETPDLENKYVLHLRRQPVSHIVTIKATLKFDRFGIFTQAEETFELN